MRRATIETLFRVLNTQGLGVEARQVEQGQALVKMTLLALWSGLRVMTLLLSASSVTAVDQHQRHTVLPSGTGLSGGDPASIGGANG
jgi:hypothetical protein